MARLILPFDEAIALQRSQQPLPPEVESLASSGDTLLVKINPRDHLPKLLQRLNPVLNLKLTFRRFTEGRAAFEVKTALNTWSVTALSQLLLKIVSLPELKGVTLHVGDQQLTAWIDIQTLINEEVGGVKVTDFQFADNTFIIDVDLSNFSGEKKK